MRARRRQEPDQRGQIARRLRREIKRRMFDGGETGRENKLNYIARRAKVDYKALWHFIHDDADIRLSAVQKLCDFLDLTLVVPIRVDTAVNKLLSHFAGPRPTAVEVREVCMAIRQFQDFNRESDGR